MTRSTRWMAAGLGTLAAAAVLTWAQAGPAQPVGSIVLVPGPAAPAGGGAQFGTVAIVACETTPEGLRVHGRVTRGQAAAGGTLANVVVLVAPGAVDDAGVGVSAGYASSAGKADDAQPGDFVVTLGWATRDSTFAVLDQASPAEASSTGPVARCPLP